MGPGDRFRGPPVAVSAGAVGVAAVAGPGDGVEPAVDGWSVVTADKG
jgi:hypothetical protein